MIPLKIHVKNFISYGSATQTIDFTPYNLICLSGKNGHGKSALLDALTWAIWGQARKISGIAKADDGLVRLGQTQMMVSIDFSCGTTHYRVRREFNKSPKMQTNLEFGIIDHETSQFKALTDKTIKATQEKIENLIGIDYESFINSAFLRQGQSNEFSKKSARDRKEILANILGLNKFESLKKLAYEHARSANIERDYITNSNQNVKVELEQKNVIDSELELVLLQLSQLSGSEKNLATDMDANKLKQFVLAQAISKFEQLKYQKSQSIERHELLVQDFKAGIASIRKLFSLNRNVCSISQLEIERDKTQAQILAAQDNSRKAVEFKEKILTLKEKLLRRTQEIENNFLNKRDQVNLAIEQNATSIRNLSMELDNLLLAHKKNMAEVILLEKEVAAINITEDSNLKNSLFTNETQFERRKAFWQKFTARLDNLKTIIAEVESNKNRIEQTEDPVCPLCLQDLPQEAKLLLLENMKRKSETQLRAIGRCTEVLKNLKGILTIQHARLVDLKKNIEQIALNKVKKEGAQKNLSRLMSVLDEIKNSTEKVQAKLLDAQQKSEILRKNKCEIEEQYFKALEGDPETKRLKDNLRNLEVELKDLNYNPGSEIALNQKMESILKQLQEHSQLIKEMALVNERKKNVSLLNAEIKKIRIAIANLNQELEKFAELENQQKKLVELEQKINVQINQNLSQKEILLQAKGRLEQQQKQMDEKQKEYSKSLEHAKNLEKIYDDYSLISHALGKDGIQALLIEDAIPEIENEANDLLAKLTDNQAQLFIESLRDLRQGGTKETLDIKISDACGLRPYELFSGGEAFRIDFALRIAISKLLARRSGTALETLIIDEGFGSQDEEGLAHIMDALLKIQDDFAKIIIVSHLPSMKDQFPVHFYIHKNAQGSCVKVIENA